jgi:hypothetical protein
MQISIPLRVFFAAKRPTRIVQLLNSCRKIGGVAQTAYSELEGYEKKKQILATR